MLDEDLQENETDFRFTAKGAGMHCQAGAGIGSATP